MSLEDFYWDQKPTAIEVVPEVELSAAAEMQPVQPTRETLVPLYDPSVEDYLADRADKQRVADRRKSKFTPQRHLGTVATTGEVKGTRDPHFEVMPFAKGMPREAGFMPDEPEQLAA